MGGANCLSVWEVNVVLRSVVFDWKCDFSLYVELYEFRGEFAYN